MDDVTTAIKDIIALCEKNGTLGALREGLMKLDMDGDGQITHKEIKDLDLKKTFGDFKPVYGAMTRADLMASCEIEDSDILNGNCAKELTDKNFQYVLAETLKQAVVISEEGYKKDIFNAFAVDVAIMTGVAASKIEDVNHELESHGLPTLSPTIVEDVVKAAKSR